MRTLIWICLIILAPAFAYGQEPRSLSVFDQLTLDEQRIVATWLSQDCGVDERSRLLDQIKALGTKLEPVFWEAYREGPKEKNVAQFRERLARQYEERQARLEDIGPDLFGKEETQRLLSVTRSQYVSRELEQYQYRYRSAALTGLGVVGTQLDGLEKIATDKNDPLQGTAQEAVRMMRDRTNR